MWVCFRVMATWSLAVTILFSHGDFVAVDIIGKCSLPTPNRTKLISSRRLLRSFKQWPALIELKQFQHVMLSPRLV